MYVNTSAGGLIGLAQFISSQAGQGDTLLVGGMFTVGAAIQHHSAVTLLDTTPLARLTVDNVVVAVPNNSKFKTADDLIEAMLSTPESISWVGGSRAGVDEVNLYEIARALGIASSRLRYTGLSGGGEVGTALALGNYQIGISGYSEFENLVEGGRLRVLAVASAETNSKIAAPTFESLGIVIQRFNWRGVFAPPGINQVQLETLNSIVDQLAKSQEWQDLLSKYHWQDAYLSGPEFTEFVEAEQKVFASDLLAMKEVNPVDNQVISGVLLRRYTFPHAITSRLQALQSHGPDAASVALERGCLR